MEFFINHIPNPASTNTSTILIPVVGACKTLISGNDSLYYPGSFLSLCLEINLSHIPNPALINISTILLAAWPSP